MKLRTFLTASAATLSLFVAPQLAAQEAAPAPVEAVEEVAAPSPALWKVADEDTTIWMFGTIHFLPDSLDWKNGPIAQALTSSGELVTEIDMTPEKMAELAQVMQRDGMLTDGKTLRGLMNEDQLATFDAGMIRMGMPVTALDALEPWFAALVVLQTILPAAGVTADNGVETVLESVASPDIKRIGLEDTSTHISALDGLPMESQIAFLLSGIEDPAEGIAALNAMIDVWANGDPDALGDLMNEALESDPILAERLLYARNANWAEWIDTRLDQPGVVFMAVGAGHLAGDKSVQDYLAERGIETKRVQ